MKSINDDIIDVMCCNKVYQNIHEIYYYKDINIIYFQSNTQVPFIYKNPYNNLLFNKSSLYNIYFAIKKSDYIFHQYFLCLLNHTFHGVK